VPKDLTTSLSWLAAAWVVQSVPWSFPWILHASPLELWSIMRGEFYAIALSHVVIGVSSAVAPILLWRRLDLAAAWLLTAAAIACLYVAGIFLVDPNVWQARSMLWFAVPRAMLSALTLAVVLLHAIGRIRAADEHQT
jgi:hypothetical protein